MPWPPRGERPSKEPDDRRRAGLGPGPAGVRDRAGRWPSRAPPAAGRPGRCCWPARPSWPTTPSGWAGWPTRSRREDPLPPPLRVFQRLYEVAAARVPARLPAAEQRPDPPPGRRRQRPRRRVDPAGTLPPGHGRPPRPAPRPGGLDRPGGRATSTARASGSTRRASARGSPPATPRPSRCPTGPSWTSCSARPAST